MLLVYCLLSLCGLEEVLQLYTTKTIMVLCRSFPFILRLTKDLHDRTEMVMVNLIGLNCHSQKKYTEQEQRWVLKALPLKTLISWDRALKLVTPLKCRSWTHSVCHWNSEILICEAGTWEKFFFQGKLTGMGEWQLSWFDRESSLVSKILEWNSSHVFMHSVKSEVFVLCLLNSFDEI